VNVVVFGATGFVGRNVCEVLAEAGIPHRASARSLGVELRDAEATAAFLREVEPTAIVNCAAHVGSLNYVTRQAAEVITDNSRMLLGMYEAIAKSCPRALVVNPIANCAYPAQAETFVEDDWWNGHLHRSVLSYGATRRLLWAVGECYAMQHGVRSISLLVPNMYGPHDSTNPDKAHALNALVSKFVKAQREKAPRLEIWGTGVAVREWLYAPDFARVVRQILLEPNLLGLDQPLNVAQNFGLSVRELSQLIQRHFRYDGEVVWNHAMPDGAPRKVMDDRRFQKVFPGFAFTELAEGLARTIDYYESQYPY